VRKYLDEGGLAADGLADVALQIIVALLLQLVVLVPQGLHAQLALVETFLVLSILLLPPQQSRLQVSHYKSTTFCPNSPPHHCNLGHFFQKKQLHKIGIILAIW
jgi:hypothetical protein